MVDIFNIILNSCLNPMENSWYSCFSRLSAWLCPSCKFWPAFCGSWFHQFSFQRLCSAIQIWSTCVPCLELELWSVLCIVQFSKSVYARKVHFYSYLLKIWVGAEFYQILFCIYWVHCILFLLILTYNGLFLCTLDDLWL